MLKVSHSLPDIAVLRGGNKDFKQSLSEGGEVLVSLSRIGYEPVDVLIGKDGEWTSKGFPTDAHKVYSQAHTIIDTTRMKGEEYQLLAKKMQIPLIFGEGEEVKLSREDLYRVLRQQEIKVPDTFVVRAHEPLKDEIFRDVWTKFHTPLLVRPLHKQIEVPSKIVRMFHDLESTVRDYHGKGVDIHVLTYRNTHTTSMAVLPNFRKDDAYTPMWVDSFSGDGQLPNKESSMRPHLQAPEFRKENMHAIAKKVYKALGLTTPACIDFIRHNNEFIVVNVDLNPSLRKDGRFMQSLATTGVDAGHYIHECIKNETENERKR
jgi:D-alanine-D-alanine ligase-like ATP-grasp enzyme